MGGAHVPPTATLPLFVGWSGGPQRPHLPTFPPCRVRSWSLVSARILLSPFAVSAVTCRCDPAAGTLWGSCWARAPAAGGAVRERQPRQDTGEDCSSGPHELRPGLCPQRLRTSRSPSRSARQPGTQDPRRRRRVRKLGCLVLCPGTARTAGRRLGSEDGGEGLGVGGRGGGRGGAAEPEPDWRPQEGRGVGWLGVDFSNKLGENKARDGSVCHSALPPNTPP